MATPIQAELNFLGVVSRNEANDRGLLRYYTGEPCRNGHIAERFVSSRCCAECLREKWRRKKRSPEHRARAREWKKANREKVKVHNLRARQKRIRDLKANNAQDAIRHSNKLVKMAGRPKPACCETCGRRTQRLCFDHCHQSGKFRGWLCQQCNAALGMVHDSPAVLRRLTDYLEQAQNEAAQQQAAAQVARQGNNGDGGAEAQT